MYRVELKDCPSPRARQTSTAVPNVPCGVESVTCWRSCPLAIGVPNVPCGVERMDRGNKKQATEEFLMYRVELKAIFLK